MKHIVKVGTPTSQHTEYELPITIASCRGGVTREEYEACHSVSEPYGQEEDSDIEFFTITEIGGDQTLNLTRLVAFVLERLDKVSGEEEHSDYYPQLCMFTVAYAYCFSYDHGNLVKNLIYSYIEDSGYYADESFPGWLIEIGEQ